MARDMTQKQQKQHLTLCLRAQTIGKLGWISRFDLASTCTLVRGRSQKGQIWNTKCFSSSVAGNRRGTLHLGWYLWYHLPALHTTKRTQTTNPAIKYALYDANEALVNTFDLSHVSAFDICSAPYFLSESPAGCLCPCRIQPLICSLNIMIPSQSRTHLRKWLDPKLQPYAHTFIALWLSMCSTFNPPPGCTIWEMLKDILPSFMILAFLLFFFFSFLNVLPCTMTA